jgi:hypothetical protein
MFTDVELAGDMELATPVEKATAGGRRGGEGGRQAAVLWCRGDASRLSRGAMEREARWRGRRDGEHGRRGGAAERGHGELSWCCGEVSFFLFFVKRLGA